MSTVTVHNPEARHISIDGAGEMVSTRIQSIDILRGLNMALMIFVNELAGVHGLPWWTYHAKTQWDAMTYVDMVFPGFLFLVGMSLPIALNARLKKNASQVALWGHVLLRSFSLYVLGLVLANGHDADPTLMHGLPRRWWSLLGVLGCSLFLLVMPKDAKKWLKHGLHVLGLALVVFCFAIFRRTMKDGSVGWVNWKGYPEILGLIGIAYFAVCLMYIPTRRWRWAPVGWLAAIVGFNALTMPPMMQWMTTNAGWAANIVSTLRHSPFYLWPWENGSSASMVMAGIVLTVIYLETKWTLRKKVYAAMGYALATGVLGLALMPLGISKNRGTPTWCLWTMAACIVLFVALYWICDVRKKTAWAWPVKSAGANTLTTYLLPDYWGMVLGVAGIRIFANPMLHGNWTGVVWCFVFTGIMLAISTVLTRYKVRLAL